MEITTYTGTGTDTPTTDVPAPLTGPGSVKSDLMRIDRRCGTVVREGPWLVAGRIEVRLAAGDARLDFSEAVINVDTVYLDVDLGLGGELTLVVPPGVKVVGENLDARLGDFDMRAPCDDATPVFLRIEVSGRLHGGGDLVVRRPRRNFDQWTRPDRAT